MNELIDPNMYYGDREHFFFLERTITEKDVRDFANVIGDLNPIHFDEEYAKTARFSKPIVHGEFLAGLVSSVLGNKNPGNGTILLQNKMRFVGPVYVGQKVKVITRLERWEPLKFPWFRWFRKKPIAVMVSVVRVQGEDDYFAAAYSTARVIPPRTYMRTYTDRPYVRNERIDLSRMPR